MKIIIKENTTAEEIKTAAKSENTALAFDRGIVIADPRVRRLIEVGSNFSFFQKLEEKTSKTLNIVDKEELHSNPCLFYIKAVKKIEEEIEKVERVNNIYAPCHKGCYECCKNNMITITIQEAYIIKQYIESPLFPEEKRKIVKERIEEQAKFLKKQKIDKINVSIAFSDHAIEIELRERHFKFGLPCVFLEDGICLIHEVRPMDCWAFKQYASEYFCKDSLYVMGAFDFAQTKKKMMRLLMAEMNEIIDEPSFYIINGEYHCVMDTLPGLVNEALNEW